MALFWEAGEVRPLEAELRLAGPRCGRGEQVPSPRAVIIGVPPGGRPEGLGRWLSRARVVAGGRRHLAGLDLPPGVRQVELDRGVEEKVAELAREEGLVLFLASGDPGLFGLTRTVTRHFPPAEVRIEPAVSSMQLAFARAGLSWEDALLTSVHARPLESLLEVLGSHQKVGVFTSPEAGPREIARLLLQGGMTDVSLWVAEDLGLASERVRRFTPEEALRQGFSGLNVVILLREGELPSFPPLGLEDESFERRVVRRGVITRREVRGVVLSLLSLRPGDIFWDVGAGSGAVALEAWPLVRPGGAVYAVERDPKAARMLRGNSRRLGRPIRMVEGEAPEVLAELPSPDAIFVGGSGGRLREIVIRGGGSLRSGGRFLVSAITLETLEAAREAFGALGWEAEITAVQISRSRRMGERWTVLDPFPAIYLVRAVAR